MKKTALLALAVALVLLAACTVPAAPAPSATPSPQPQEEILQPTPAPTPDTAPKFSYDEYPRVDGSTANLPLMAAVLSRVTGMELPDAEAHTSCTTTPYAYESLINGTADLLLVYEAAEETKELIENSGVALDFIPIGRDALVFIANESNPVSGLTISQLTDIYTGKITNWKAVGGEDSEIAAFQRSSSSGSQALFMKLLMKGKEPMQAPTEFYPTEMGALIEALAEYNNAGNAIGYSVYYYANYMYAKPGLKFLAINGVAPSDESIASGKYPFVNEFFAVVRANEPEDSPARQIANWLSTPQGKELIRDAGYVPTP
ncbi:MAG: PstS family phosphate ABC transporter substrate-binding protein [Christensenellales bacterium]|jgi:phosphate transport system substrate-binding protein